MKDNESILGTNNKSTSGDASWESFIVPFSSISGFSMMGITGPCTQVEHEMGGVCLSCEESTSSSAKTPLFPYKICMEEEDKLCLGQIRSNNLWFCIRAQKSGGHCGTIKYTNQNCLPVEGKYYFVLHPSLYSLLQC
eukprot:7162944-Ditylum_brightwellii.AAC.1